MLHLAENLGLLKILTTKGNPIRAHPSPKIFIRKKENKYFLMKSRLK